MTYGRISVGLAVLWAGAAVAAEQDPLAGYRWRSRVLVISAPAAEDPSARAQRAIAATAEMAERDLVTVEAYGEEPASVALRRRFGLSGGAFRAVLVGKDGGAKLIATDPIPAATLASTIDAMPMRRDEMQRRP